MESDPTIPCPNCGEPMYDDAPQCPYCGHYPTDAELNPGFPPWLVWIIVLTTLGLVLPFIWPFLANQ